VEIANVEMAAAWDGHEGDDWTENAARYEATDRWIAPRFEAACPIQATDHVLDIGCGTGSSTRSAARRAAAGAVLGVDLSSKMLEYARNKSRAEGITNVEYVQADAQVHQFDPAAFDLAISHFGAMFFNDPVAAFTNIAGALRRGGRLALLAWQPFERNEWLSAIFAALDAGRSLPRPTPGSPGPFGLAEPERVREIMRTSGLSAIELTPVEEPVLLGADADDAWSFVRGLGVVRGLTGGLDDAPRQAALDRLREVVDASVTPDGAVLGSAAWLITATRPS
jgi:SAM-dependent methyltransferase